MFFTHCKCRKFKSLYLSSLIFKRQGVFNLLTPDAARSASVEPIGDMYTIVKGCCIFGKLSELTNLIVSKKRYVGSFSSYTALLSTHLFFFDGFFS